MHNLLGLIFILSSVIFYKPEIITEPPQLTREEIKNLRIKSITVYAISNKLDSLNNHSFVREKSLFSKFDTNGNLVYQDGIRIHVDAPVNFAAVNKFDDKGNLIESTIFEGDSININNDYPYSIEKQEYDSNNVCVEDYLIDNPKDTNTIFSIYKAIYNYRIDNLRRIIYRKNENFGKDDIKRRYAAEEFFIYGNNNKIQQYIFYGIETLDTTSLIYHDTTSFYYDSMNRLILEINNYQEKKEYSYNNTENLISEFRYSGNCYSFFYDSLKRLIKKMEYNNNILDNENYWTYGTNNQILEEIAYYYYRHKDTSYILKDTSYIEKDSPYIEQDSSYIEKDTVNFEKLRLGKQITYIKNDTIIISATRVKYHDHIVTTRSERVGYYDYHVLPTIYKYEYEYYEKEGKKE